MYALVALPLALAPLTYQIPDEFISRAKIGSAVRVPLRKGTEFGVIIQVFTEKPSGYSVKPLLELYPDDIALPPSVVKLIQWISDYYHYPIGQVLQQALPPNALFSMLDRITGAAATRLNRQINKLCIKRPNKKYSY